MSNQTRNGREYSESGDPIIKLGELKDGALNADCLLAALDATPPLSALPAVKFPIIESINRKSHKWSAETILAVSRSNSMVCACTYCSVLLINDDVKSDLYYWWHEFDALELDFSKDFIEIARCRENPNSPLFTRPFEYTDEWFDKYTRPLRIDHDLPVWRGGSDAIGNLCLSCPSCNSKKGILTTNEYLSGKTQAEIRSVIDGMIALSSELANQFDEDGNSLQSQAWRSVHTELPE